MTYSVTWGEGAGESLADGTAFIGVPAVTYGATQAAGVGPSLLATDSVLGFPSTLQSTANATTLALTDDAVNQFLTGSLGSLELKAASGGGVAILVNSASAASTSLSVEIRPGAGNLTGIQPSVFGAALASQTVRCWNVLMGYGSSSVLTSSTLVGYDVQTLSAGLAAGSDTANQMYGLRITNPQITNATGGWSEVSTALLNGPKRSISNPAVTASYTAHLTCPVISSTTQAGIYIAQQTAQQAATNRYGILVDSHNSGTNRWSLWGSNKIHCDASDFIANASGFGFSNKDSQSSSAGGGGTARFWRAYVDASATGVAGDCTFNIDSTGVLAISRAGGATGTVQHILKDVGTAPVTT